MTDEEETTSEGRTLEETPTWAIATVCFLLIFISILIEHLLHLLAQYFNKKRRRSLIQALEKIKSDLILFGFISLLLTVSERQIASICITKSLAETFLPCGTNDSDAYSNEETKCLEQEKVSFLSREGVKQLQFLIFILAFFHSLSSVLTFSLGMAKPTTSLISSSLPPIITVVADRPSPLLPPTAVFFFFFFLRSGSSSAPPIWFFLLGADLLLPLVPIWFFFLGADLFLPSSAPTGSSSSSFLPPLLPSRRRDASSSAPTADLLCAVGPGLLIAFIVDFIS